MRLQIFVPIYAYPDGSSDKLALHVAAVARHLEGEVHALILDADFPPVPSLLGTTLIDVPAMIGDAKAKARARGAALGEALKAGLAAAGVPFRTSKEVCFPAVFGDKAATQARYHDLAVIGLEPKDSALQGVAEAVVFGSGRPTLLVPEQEAPAAFRHVMIAWDGSRVAARAVSDARDFLRRAGTVTILSVVDEKPIPGDDPGGRLAEYLARHDIKANVVRVRGGDSPIAQSLQDHAREIGADLLVMGAFGHSRMQDFVLGGATTGILKGLQVPALLSH